MQDERIEQRVRAAYRARACAAGVACGAQIFAVGTGLLLPLALNAAYWAAVPALLLSGVIGLAAPRRLSKAPGSAFCAVLALSLLVCGALLLAAGATLAQQTLLPNGHLLTCLMLTLGFCLLAARLCDTGLLFLHYRCGSPRWPQIPLSLWCRRGIPRPRHGRSVHLRWGSA